MASNNTNNNNTQNTTWLSNILRPRASSISVESCLNLPPLTSSNNNQQQQQQQDSHPLDARPILTLLDPSQPLSSRCKHLVTFSALCKNYKFTHLENVFFTVQDILDPTMPRESRHVVFDFMLACIVGQYTDLGMARVTFYSALRHYNNWDDFEYMYKCLFALVKEGRDISGFEKNVCKLLIHWLDIAILNSKQQHQQNNSSNSKKMISGSTSHNNMRGGAKATTEDTIPYLADILHLLTLTAKFNFALFEEDEVTEMIKATHKAFFASHCQSDLKASLEFTDIVVRYRFVPFDALKPFLEILAASSVKTQVLDRSLYWPIFLNLLRSHCAHSAMLTLCKFLDLQPTTMAKQDGHENNLIKGAIHLLAETAWGIGELASSGKSNTTSVVGETYMVSDTVILMYFKRAAQKGNDTINGTIINTLTSLLTISSNSSNNNNTMLSLMEWDALWDIVDVITRYILKSTDNNSNNDIQLFDFQACSTSYSPTSCIYQFSKFSQTMIQLQKEKTYKGPLTRWISVLYQLRTYCQDETSHILLDYYVTEHSFLPSTEGWLQLLQEITNTFFIHSTSPKIRGSMLKVVTDVCSAVKDFYSEVMYETIVIPMMQHLDLEKHLETRQLAIDLLVASLSDCQNEKICDELMAILKSCAHCQCIGVVKEEPPAASVQALRNVSGIRHQQQQHHRGSAATTTTATSSTPKFVTDTRERTVNNTTEDGCIGVLAMCGITELFENLLMASNGKLCKKTFDIITQIANDKSDLNCPFGGPKIVALDLLLRFRCPTNHHLYLIDDNVQEEPYSVIAGVRSTIKKRQEAHEKKKSSERFIPGGPALSVKPPPPANTSSTATTPSTTIVKPVFHPSPHVFSYNEKLLEEEEEKGKEQGNEVVLDINQMLKSYVRVLSHSPNWSVVLFLLRRLPQQLSNKHLFCGASPYINKLRRRLVKWTSTRKFLERVTNLPAHIKRNDLNVYAYSLLTVLISYRRVFTEPKQDQDEIVYAFYVGIMQVTSATRLCINSLSVCCHELPLSVAKMLNEILQRMSQIISVASVSVHILEFLSALARLPNLYANFTGDMYKPVFAIALNYLQHSQQQQQQQQQQQVSPLSTPSASPSMMNSPVNNTQQNGNGGALKQYVLIMAYLVITVWFTAIPLRERRKHVPFIIQRLLSGKTIDEQTYTCIDMLSRFTFADVSLAPEKSIVSKILMGDSSTGEAVGNTSTSATTAAIKQQSQRTWVYGHTLLTLRTAKSVGWVEVTIRRPSGTVSMMCYVENKLKSNDIDYRTLPALLMMQYQPDLMASKIIQDKQQEEVMTTTSGGSGGDGSALGITFNDTPVATPRRPSEQAVVSATVATRSEGLVMAPSFSDENTTPTDQQPPALSPRRPSLTQKGLTDLLNKDSKEKAPTVAGVENTAEAAVRQVLSEPSNNTNERGTASSSFSSNHRKVEPSIDPGFLYLQLNNYPDVSSVKSMTDISPPLPDDEATARTLATFDRIPVVDFHKIGVLYVGKGQTHELEILANTYGSPDYVRFLNSLGTIQRLRGRNGNSGGLDREMDIDGKFAYFWKDDVTETVFHVATMMPTNLDRDPQCSAKKRHIGNDYVSIVYNDSGSDYVFDTLPSQFNFINIVVSPHSISTEAVSPSHALIGQENTFFKVEMQKRPDMPDDIGPLSEPKLVSAQSLPGFVRLAAIHANIFAQVFWQSRGGREYVSHWRERLKQVQRIKERVLGAANKNNVGGGTGTSNIMGDHQGSATPNLTSVSAPTTPATAATPVTPSSATAAGKTIVANSKDYEALLDFTKYA